MKLKQRHAEKLLTLAAFLRELPAKKFDLERWLSKGDPVKAPCGTVACACGWATSIPSFRRAGLKMGKSFKDIGFTRVDVGHTISYRGHESWDAVMVFFGLDRGDAEHLFSSLEYPRHRRGPKSVAQRIERFVSKHGVAQ